MSADVRPKISVVTACFNRAALVADAIESVLAQDYPNFEHIIIDGASTDGSLEVLARYPHLKVVSEPDRGIFDAWNKGLRLASGEVIGILNSDDVYASGSFQAVASAFREQPHLDLVTGTASQFQVLDNGDWEILCDYVEPPGPTLDLKRLLFWGPIINARFLHARVYEKLGLYDMRFKAADGHFAIRLAASRASCRYLDQPICYYRSHPGSFSMNLEGLNQLDCLTDKLDYAEDLLQSASLSDEDLNIIRWRHSEQAVRATVQTGLQFRWGLSLRLLARGWRWHGVFPAVLFRDVASLVGYQLSKPFRQHATSVMPPPVHLAGNELQQRGSQS